MLLKTAKSPQQLVTFFPMFLDFGRKKNNNNTNQEGLTSGTQIATAKPTTHRIFGRSWADRPIQRMETIDKTYIFLIKIIHFAAKHFEFLFSN